MNAKTHLNVLFIFTLSIIILGGVAWVDNDKRHEAEVHQLKMDWALDRFLKDMLLHCKWVEYQELPKADGYLIDFLLDEPRGIALVVSPATNGFIQSFVVKGIPSEKYKKGSFTVR